MVIDDLNERYVNFYADFAFKKFFGACRGWFSVLDTAESKGIANGREEGRLEGIAISGDKKAFEISRNLKACGVDTSTIAQTKVYWMKILQYCRKK